MRSVVTTCLAALLCASGCQTSSATDPASPERQPLEPSAFTVELEALPLAPFETAEIFVEASWIPEDEISFARETIAAATGPMAIAAERDGGVSVLDTVAGRVVRFDRAGQLRSTVPIGFVTGDDLALLPDGGFAVLAYERLPEPHHTLVTFDPDGVARGQRLAPQAVTLPTALVADGDRLLVEQRHGWLHAADGSPRQWGRTAGDLQLRASLTEDRSVRLVARDRRGGRELWQTTVETPWPVTELLALDGSEPYVAVVLRRVHEEDDHGPAWQETWLVALDRSGAPLGRLELRDSRITDSGRPFDFAPNGDLFELVTDESGARLLRYAWAGGAS